MNATAPQPDRATVARRNRTRYIVLCTLLGLTAGWLPRFFHGPIPYKFDIFGINGGIVVWAFYLERMLTGFLVAITGWPRPWYVRGPLCGLLAMVPVCFVVLATPGCGPP
jgi:hypothetical protein